MRASEFKKLKEEKTPQKIIGLYTHGKIYLTKRQLDQLIELKKDKRKTREHLEKPLKIRLRTRIHTIGLRIRGVLNEQ